MRLGQLWNWGLQGGWAATGTSSGLVFGCIMGWCARGCGGVLFPSVVVLLWMVGLSVHPSFSASKRLGQPGQVVEPGCKRGPPPISVDNIVLYICETVQIMTIMFYSIKHCFSKQTKKSI